MQARKSEAVTHGDGARGWEAQVNHPLALVDITLGGFWWGAGAA